ncbi:hypothetical protein [Virgibacillus pantothenticus]|uniref:Uncharacterized protein n=1 Tax=Virgibacillus pantothenticus TaxID=1473 RepID=A0A0L0QM38_VIRPA|nr:hypothetical protein [Virgibacillus pantothenticus]KNE19685.1 hypothetical protein AFK71_14645 [Virgibacillus pantothenticus]MED3735882.1 hypothetical protein [Virgibacillus pantothenticus]QTY14785.1 hypothetical protein KBP50_12655 [Virgibacillus pantothenticus]SIT15111.1 hypothetical protein SAMN05421787_1238 [Virgibacillus pantothenticus]
MKGSDEFHLEISQERFDDIMQGDPAIRQQRAKYLKEDMEEIFILPDDNAHLEVKELYEQIKAVADGLDDKALATRRNWF